MFCTSLSPGTSLRFYYVNTFGAFILYLNFNLHNLSSSTMVMLSIIILNVSDTYKRFCDSSTGRCGVLSCDEPNPLLVEYSISRVILIFLFCHLSFFYLLLLAEDKHLSCYRMYVVGCA